MSTQLSNAEFLRRLNVKFPNREYEILEDYTNNMTHLLVKNRYGICSMKPYDLMRGREPSITSAIDTYEYSVSRFHETHNFLYEYPRFIYKDAEQIITVKCKKHGEFQQKILNHYSGAGCSRCSVEGKADVNRWDKEKLIVKLQSIRNDKYEYRIPEYKTTKDLIEVVCPKHGVFKMRISQLLLGSGCPKCIKRKGGYSRGDFVKASDGRICKLYVISCALNGEYFCKVGITSRSVEERFSTKGKMPYSYTIEFIHEDDADSVWRLERDIKKKFKGYNYLPKISFRGEYECFYYYFSEDIIDYIRAQKYEEITEEEYELSKQNEINGSTRCYTSFQRNENYSGSI